MKNAPRSVNRSAKPPAEVRKDSLRVGQLFGSRPLLGTEPTAVLLGFPSDEGVRRNRGRPGACDAPRLIREAFCALPAGDDPFLRILLHGASDLGDLAILGDVEADQIALAQAIAPWLARGVAVLILGGGHETSFGHFLGYVCASRDVSILNWDAHPDVRPLVGGKGHSGSPFRQALLHESRRCRRYVVAGLQPSASPDHLAFIQEHGGAYEWADSLSLEAINTITANLPRPAMISFDMDAVDEALAPGVSAPARNGLSAELWLHAAYAAGLSPATTSMDLVEVNPKFDSDGRTLRLAAETLLAFLKGLARRNQKLAEKKN